MKDPMNRRDMLRTAGKFGLGAAIASAVPAFAGGAGAQGAQSAADVDIAVLNFALNLEYLEAAFYAAAVGRLNEVRALGGGAQILLPAGVDGARGINFTTPAVRQYMQEIAEDEIAHVRFLRTALGRAAVDRPVIDLGPSFAAAGRAASGGAIGNFNPYAGELFFLHGAFIFEDVGVTAYKGAAPLLTNKAFLSAAAGILAVEAYHAGEIRTLLHQQRDVTAAAGLRVSQIVDAISNLRDSVDGSDDRDQGIVRADRANIVPTDQNGIAFGRDTRQVLNIVYLAPNAMRGGFFPNGLNGAIR